MQTQRHFSWILQTLRQHNFLSLALDLYSFRLKLFSPELLECLCESICHFEFLVSTSCHFLSLVYLPLSRAYIHFTVMLFSSLFLLALTGSLNSSGLCNLPRTTNISFWTVLPLRWLYFHYLSFDLFISSLIDISTFIYLVIQQIFIESLLCTRAVLYVRINGKQTWSKPLWSFLSS